jgi:TnpA family transposase
MELTLVYSPSPEEVEFATSTARGDRHLLTLVVLLKSFQRLGYFPRLDDVPAGIVEHVRVCLRLGQGVALANGPERTVGRHRQGIRRFLGVTLDPMRALRVAREAMLKAAEVMDDPADLINVALEELVVERLELPAYSTLDRGARGVRAAVNTRIFREVEAGLSPAERQGLDALLEPDPATRRTPHDRIKALPRAPSLSHLRELFGQLAWLLSLGDAGRLVAGIPNAKVKHFAAQARVLDAAELRDFALPKRRTLLVCLIQQAQVKARDNLVEMFLKRMATINKRGKEELERIRVAHRQTTEKLVSVLGEMLQSIEEHPDDAEAGHEVRGVAEAQGGVAALREDCEAVSAYHGDNYLPLLWRFYKSHRPTLFQIARALTLRSTSRDDTVMAAVDFLLEHEKNRGESIAVPPGLLVFASDAWRHTLRSPGPTPTRVPRRHFEVCVFAHLAAELRSGDVAVDGSETYADYRSQLLSWGECESLVADYCRELGIPDTAGGLVQGLRSLLADTAERVDRGYADNRELVISDKGEPTLKSKKSAGPDPDVARLEAALFERMPERSIIDALCHLEHWLNWTRHLGPLSGSDPKIDRAVERYILCAFTYGSNLGAAQAARHMNGLVTPHMLSFVNRRHVSVAKLEAVLRDLINAYHRFALPRLWGEGKVAGADGTKYDLYEQNLISEYHIRYGSPGGIVYHHVADNYVALFSHFIPCGVWEAIYIIEGLLRNTSDIQPTSVTADTQGQSTPVFGLAHLLGIKLMPRIRNWKDLVFYLPFKGARYQHIEALFGEAIDWHLIETHWQDLLRVVLSIKAGKVSSAVLLRKLGNYSRKNRLYLAFRELGRVVRTVFLLEFISDPKMREGITAVQNKVEAYNGFAQWVFFGGEGVIAQNDPEEQEKAVKYNDLVATAVAIQNVVDMSAALRSLIDDSYPVTRETVAGLSPYITRKIKRFGDYVIDLSVPEPLDGALALAL